MPHPDGSMTLREAQTLKAEFLGHARRLALIAGDEGRSSGLRYWAAVMGDAALDVAREADSYIREFCHG